MFKRKDLITLVKEELKKYIIDSGLQAGEVLPTEAEFAEMFEVSRTIIREAFSGLESLQIIESKQGKGRYLREVSYDVIVDSFSFIIEMEPEEFQNILNIRIALESYYLPKMMDQISEDDIRELSAILKEMNHLVESVEINEKKLIELHKDFHKVLYRRSGNTFLIKMIELFSRMQKYFFVDRNLETNSNEEFIRKHEQLLELIVNKKDVGEITNIINSHFDNISLDIDRVKALN